MVGFFGNRAASPSAHRTPSDVKFTDRPDMVIAAYLTKQHLQGDVSVEKVFAKLQLPTKMLGLSSPQTMDRWLNQLTSALKKAYIETPSSAEIPANASLIDAFALSLELTLNFAKTKENQTLPLKTYPGHLTDISIHTENNHVYYTVPVELGDHFAYLNQRASHATDAALDEKCQAHFEEQKTHTRLMQQARQPELVQAVCEHKSTPQALLEAQYINSIGTNSADNAHMNYNTYHEALAAGVALSEYAKRLELTPEYTSTFGQSF